MENLLYHLSRLFIVTTLLFSSCSHNSVAQNETDFGQVGRKVATLLQRHHYSQMQLDDDVSAKFLKGYMEFIDPRHVYFTEQDIARFEAKYLTTLDDKLLNEDLSPAIEIYETYRTHVKNRTKWIEEQLNTNDFNFDSNETVPWRRKDLPWPKNAAESDALWKKLITSDLLTEDLLKKPDSTPKKDISTEESDETLNTKEDLETVKVEEKEEETPEAKILKRYTRYLKDIEQVDEEEIINYYLSTLAATYDPHSEYFSFSEMEQFNISMKQELIGIGALLSMDEGAAEIQGLVVGGPADKGGELKTYDKVIGVGQGLEGEMVDVMFWNLQKIVEKIRGKEGTHVRLKVIPANADDPSNTKEIIILRDKVKLKDKLATAELIEFKVPNSNKLSRYGIISLPSFYADMQGGEVRASEHVKSLLARLIDEKIEGLIFDLRADGGGSLEEAIRITGLFVPRGPIVQHKNSEGEIRHRNSPNREPFYKGPMLVLTDKSSASASEIFAAALQDYNRAVILGESSTFGKGTVQTIVPVGGWMPLLSNKEKAGQLKVTIQKFYRIAGGSTQLKGVIPDLIVPSTRDVLDIGESSMKYALLYDQIPSLDYTKTHQNRLPIDILNSQFEARISTEPEFSYILEDKQYYKTRVEENKVSLNKTVRMKETEENKEKRKVRAKERVARLNAIKQVAEEDRPYKVYKLNLDNINNENLVPASEFSKEDSTGMKLGERKEEDQEEDFEEPEDHPYGIDPIKREALHVLNDLSKLLEISESRKIIDPLISQESQNEE